MIFFFFKNAVNRDRQINKFLTCKGQHALLSFKVKRCVYRMWKWILLSVSFSLVCCLLIRKQLPVPHSNEFVLPLKIVWSLRGMEAAILVFIFSCQLIALLSAHHPPPTVLDRNALPKIGTVFLNLFFFLTYELQGHGSSYFLYC